MTEIGRRTGILIGTTAMTATVLVGLLYNGDLAMIGIYGLIAGIMFGIAGLLIGNLIHSYFVSALIKEAELKNASKSEENQKDENSKQESKTE